MVNYHPDLDRVFRALGDPTRRTMLERLAHADRTISELADGFDMTLPAVSKHVRVLESAGLARVERRGRVRVCRLEAAPLGGAASWLADYRVFWEAALDRLGNYVENDAEEEQWQPLEKPDSSSAGRTPRRGSGSTGRGRKRKD